MSKVRDLVEGRIASIEQTIYLANYNLDKYLEEDRIRLDELNYILTRLVQIEEKDGLYKYSDHLTDS